MKLLLKWLGLISIYSVILLLAIGFVKFPRAPMKLCSQGYCDKMGNVITVNVYNLYVLWESAFLFLIIVFVISSIINMIVNRSN